MHKAGPEQLAAEERARLEGIARSAGYYVREGSSYGTTHDQLERWYIGHESELFRPWGMGWGTPGDAWRRAAEIAKPDASGKS